MLLSKRSLYGIRAVLFMAEQPRTSYVSAREISHTLDISEHYLPKILLELTRAGITRSLRGPRGGVSLSRPPTDITLSEIIDAVEGPDIPETCPLATPACSRSEPCTFCRRWASARNQLDGLFDGTTVADIRECVHLDEIARTLDTSEASKPQTH